MEIKRYIMGPLETNTYILVQDEEALIIDPAGKVEKIIELLGDLNLQGILLTHGHFDHIRACDELHEHFGCPIYLMEEDEEQARNKMSGASFGFTSYIYSPIEHLKEGIMNIGKFSFEVIKTPGHTEGSCLFKFDNDLFTGDTLFKMSIGRTDLLGGSNKKMKQSLGLIKQLDPKLIVHPGHEAESTLEFELLNNPYLS